MRAARACVPGLLFAAVFQQLTLAVWKKMKALLGSGALGRIIRATWVVTDWFRPQAYFANGWRGTWKGDGGRVLMNQAPLVAPASDGIHSVMMANAVILSALRGMPVDLPLRGGELAAILAERAADAARAGRH